MKADQPPLSPSPAAATDPAPPVTPVTTLRPAVTARLVSLDAFRGITIILMLLVNNVMLDAIAPGQLRHAAFGQGIHVADLVFPWFLFCMGAALPFAYTSFARRYLVGRPWTAGWRWHWKNLVRAFWLVALGSLIDSSLNLHPTFGFGVLQLTGLAFLVAATFYQAPPWARLAVAGVLLVGYWATIRGLLFPGLGPGVFQEERNAILELNRRYLNDVNLTGLTSVPPTAALVIIASCVGDLLKARLTPAIKGLLLLVAGVVLLALGSLANLDLSYSKAFWTPSYILAGAGSATLALGGLTLLVDATGWSFWTYPFVVYGSNALLAYIAPILVKVYVLQNWQMRLPDGQVGSVQDWLMAILAKAFGRDNGAWAYTALYILAWWLVLLQLHRKRLFFKV